MSQSDRHRDRRVNRRGDRLKSVPPAATSVSDVDRELALTAPLPRSNGELVFDEPWQGRALGMGVVALERAGIPLGDFSAFLADAVASHGYDPAEPAAAAYYEAWLDALEACLAAKGPTEAVG